ncbi:MAG: dihydrolipoamide dehydrogenase [Alteromonadaceae bacterium]|nr:MAG: dihydrolipoamide dehydrogenase [Alteromonadaceae bacterium]
MSNNRINKINFLGAFKIAGIVGSILLLINQSDALFGDTSLRIIPAILTYCVPFIVFLIGQHSGAKTATE